MTQNLPSDDRRTEHETPRPAARARTGKLGASGRTILARTVERDVIPMLVAMPWTARGPATAAPAAVAIGPETVVEIVALSLAPDGLAVAAFVDALAGRGAAPESIYTDLLTPAARRLGVMWETDECSFADVTLGVLRLQNAQRALMPAFRGATKAGKGAPRALLMPVPGEQHTFGLSIVADFFARAGWDAWSGVVPTEKRAMQLVRQERVDVVGLSFACDERIDTAARLVAAFRRKAANPAMLVMVGGPSFVADPTLAARIGADATAVDGHQAVLRANELLLRPGMPGRAGMEA